MTRKKRKQPRRLLVNNRRNSVTDGVSLANLDWFCWWTDGEGDTLYLKVHHDQEETIHRVRCRFTETPRLMMLNGNLYWLIDPETT